MRESYLLDKGWFAGVLDIQLIKSPPTIFVLETGEGFAQFCLTSVTKESYLLPDAVINHTPKIYKINVSRTFGFYQSGLYVADKGSPLSDS